MARQGLWFQPVPLKKQNISTDVHINSTVDSQSHNPDRPSRLVSAMLKDIPHFILGKVVGAPDISVYILFPYLATTSSTGSFRSLTNEQYSRWLDRIFLPAVHEYYDAHYLQHMPASWEHGLANSRAHRVENRQIETDSYKAQSYTGYHLDPEFLGDVWTTVLHTVQSTPGLLDFRDPQLFLAAKNTKLQFKTSPSRPTLLDAMENFALYFDRYIDPTFIYIDRFYVDLGKEICPRVSLLRRQQQHTGDEAQVYCWKRCCLRSNIFWMYDGQPPSDKGAGQRFYNLNMLGDTGGLTSLVPHRSKQYKGGLIYSQYYNSVKEISDAQQLHPFEHDGLEELALDPQIRQGARHVAGGRHSDVKVLEAAYCASKNRSQTALTSSRKKSFGIREEYRISWPLFQGLLNRLQQEVETSAVDDLLIVLDDCPSYSWAIRTDTYVRFLWRSVNKFATGFEVIRAQANHELVTWEETKMMAMFLRCLRFVFGGHQLWRESGLWWSRRERSLESDDGGERGGLRVWYGLGFCNTLPRYGYCWFEPRIDWNRLIFKSDITDNILFGNRILQRQYLRRGGSVRDFFAATHRLELALRWVTEYHNINPIRNRLITWIVHLCLQQFRVDVLTTVKAEIREEYQDESLQDPKPFCFAYLDEIMTDGVHLVSGNKTMFKDPGDLVMFLFNHNDGRIRSHWDDRPFRKLYRRAYTALQLVHGGLMLQHVLARRLPLYLYMYHWVLPYPCPESFMQTTKQSQRMWYSIQRQGDDWVWAGKSYMTGEQDGLPEYMEWDKHEWELWIQEKIRQQQGQQVACRTRGERVSRDRGHLRVGNSGHSRRVVQEVEEEEREVIVISD
jgi:hypothetical protein